MQSHPLTDAELARLEDCILTIGDGCEAMTPEMMDGFFCALICGPEVVPPSEYMPLIFGVDSMDEIAFRDIEEAQQVFDLLNRHWNTIAATLLRNEVYPALVGEEEDGTVTGREWAWGFQLGMHLREGLGALGFRQEAQHCPPTDYRFGRGRRERPHTCQESNNA